MRAKKGYLNDDDLDYLSDSDFDSEDQYWDEYENYLEGIADAERDER